MKLNHSLNRIAMLCVISIAYGSIRQQIDTFKGIEIYTDSQLSVEHYLLSPGSASFPVYDESMLTKINDSTFNVKSYVDSQNKMGGLMRSYYSCKIITHRRSKIYQCLNLKIKK